MKKLDLSVAVTVNTDYIEGLLQHLDSFISAQVQEIVSSSSNFAQAGILDLEKDEIIQCVRIKLWLTLQEQQVLYPIAYVKRMVHNEFIDSIRRRKINPSLPIDEEGELYQGNVIVNPSVGMADPAVEFERKWVTDQYLSEIIKAVADLPPRQKLAMINSLLEHADDLAQLLDAFKLCDLDNYKEVKWPDNKADMQRLKASLAPARHKLAQQLCVNLSEYKKRDVFETSLFCCDAS